MERDGIANAKLFVGLTEAEIDEVASHFQHVEVRVGDELTHEHDFGYSFFLVIDGHVKVLVGSEIVAELGPGDHFGEVSLVRGTKRNATVKAMDHGHLAKMMIWDFRELMEKSPVLATRLQAAAAEREHD